MFWLGMIAGGLLVGVAVWVAIAVTASKLFDSIF